MLLKFLKTIDKLRGKSYPRCSQCGRVMTPLEVNYYITQCEKCERKLLNEISCK